eukprot:2733016-Amphidinium_carterae.1
MLTTKSLGSVPSSAIDEHNCLTSMRDSGLSDFAACRNVMLETAKYEAVYLGAHLRSPLQPAILFTVPGWCRMRAPQQIANCCDTHNKMNK